MSAAAIPFQYAAIVSPSCDPLDHDSLLYSSQLAVRSGLAHIPQQLPSVVLYRLRDILISRQAFGSIASLFDCSSAYREVFAPALEGRHITLKGQDARKVLEDIIGAERRADLPTRTRPHSAPTRTSSIARTLRTQTRFGPYAPFSPAITSLQPLEPWQVGANPRRLKNRLHHRRLGVLSQCEVLTILDLAAAEVLVEAIIAAGDDERAFRDIKTFCLGPDLLWLLAEGTDLRDEIIDHFKERLRPRNVCFTLSVGAKRETMVRLESIGQLPGHDPSGDSWSKHYVCATSRVIQSLCQSWVPDNITIHNLTVENIPAVYSPRTTVFFGPSPPDPMARCDPLFWRADVRAVEVANGIVLLDEDQTAVFVGAEDFVSRDNLREEELGRMSVEERVWQQIIQPQVREELRTRVRFVSGEGAAKCGCCGKK